MSKTLAAALGALTLMATTPASALIVDAVSDGGNTVFTDFTGPGVAAVDIDVFGTDTRPSVRFVVEAGEAGGSVAFNGFLLNLVGLGIDYVNLSLSDGATFDLVGDAIGAFSTSSIRSQTDTFVSIAFDPDEASDITFGDPFLAGGIDWQIGLADLAEGDTFSLNYRIRVSEPASAALMGFGLVAAAFAARRRKVAA